VGVPGRRFDRSKDIEVGAFEKEQEAIKWLRSRLS
jgi:hypothetical protein